jgi:V8-like Glu-specific endopeptidase
MASRRPRSKPAGFTPAGAAAAALLAAACSAPDQPASASLPIIGGNFDAGDDAIVLVEIAAGLCTGTLVAPRVVMTAAHCVSEAIEDGDTANGTVRFGNGQDPWIGEVAVIDMAMHREYSPPAFVHWDIAALRLAEDAPDGIAPLAPNFEPLDPARDIGLSLRTVGFGVTDGQAQTGFGIKREVRLTADEINFYHIGVGTATQNTCQGDSGGPTLASFGSEERIVGVTSFGSDACRARSFLTRVDSMGDWLEQVIDAWSGPCQLDGKCVEDGCRTVDPDCDECGFEGSCGTDCPNIDLDCDLGARIGDPCGDEFDCESRLCLPAVDEPRLSFCTASCDPARPVETCPPPLSTCIEGSGGEPVCAYSGPTPSAQGAACEEDSECRSGLCDTDNAICVEECGDGLPDCAEPYSCQKVGSARACTLGGDEGGCGVTSGAGGASRAVPWGTFLALFCALALPLARRRRRLTRERSALR